MPESHRDGHVIDPDSPVDSVRGTRAFFDLTAADPRMEATALQTVDSKGWDGFSGEPSTWIVQGHGRIG